MLRSCTQAEGIAIGLERLCVKEWKKLWWKQHGYIYN